LNRSVLVDDFMAAGIRLTRDGDDLIAEVPADVDLSPHAERIRASKPALLRELLQREIVAAVDVEPPDFDRQHYDDLWSRYQTHKGKELPA
jgi:hypothetical protein